MRCLGVVVQPLVRNGPTARWLCDLQKEQAMCERSNIERIELGNDELEMIAEYGALSPRRPCCSSPQP